MIVVTIILKILKRVLSKKRATQSPPAGQKLIKSTTTLKNHLEKIRQTQMEIDLIIVDYGDLLKGSAVRKNYEKRHELESIYEELRGIGQEFACPIVTASQTNRKGLNEDVITMESISEAFNKCFVADLILILGDYLWLKIEMDQTALYIHCLWTLPM